MWHQGVGGVEQVLRDVRAVDEHAHEQEQRNHGQAVVRPGIDDLLRHHRHRGVPVPAAHVGEADQADEQGREAEEAEIRGYN